MGIADYELKNFYHGSFGAKNKIMNYDDGLLLELLSNLKSVMIDTGQSELTAIVTVRVAVGPSPQLLVTKTVISPPRVPAVTVIDSVPCPETIDQVAGHVQV